jgi:hypothetical protein
MMVITRIRNIAEHAVVPDSDDPLRNTRTTHAGFIERLFIAPYYVNYHLEHHLLFYVPCYNLPRVHRILSRGPHAARMEVQPNYAAVLRLATAKPASEDRPGALVSNVRRARAERYSTTRFRPASRSLFLSMISAQMLRNCREGKPVPAFPDRALASAYSRQAPRRQAKILVAAK